MEDTKSPAIEKRTGKARAIIQPSRSDDYEMRLATGFILRDVGNNSMLIEPFVDLPPIRRIRTEAGGDELMVIERKFTGGYIMSREEMRDLGQRLIDVADNANGSAERLEKADEISKK